MFYHKNRTISQIRPSKNGPKLALYQYTKREELICIRWDVKLGTLAFDKEEKKKLNRIPESIGGGRGTMRFFHHRTALP